ncbi:MAG: aldehyde dehydrogenase family protein [Nevskia sp.]|nr:aldehyde dehydrogenase family protein [Nevskia sp.]
MSLPHFDLMVKGAKSSAADFTVETPFDRSPIAKVAAADAGTVAHALNQAHQLYRKRDAWLPLSQRIEILDRAASLMHARAETLAVEAAREGGKPLLDSKVEVARAIDSLRCAVDALRTDQGEVIPMRLNKASSERLAFTQTEPIGVVVAVSAFNHPVNLITHQVGPAIAAGCPVIVKPARSTPTSCFRVVEILREAGLPEEWCSALVPENNELTTKLVTDPRVAFLSFIGSAKVGWSLRSQLAPGARCALEHGGVAPVIVAEDADFEQAIPALVKGGYYHAGQVCVSVQRVYVAKPVLKKFVEQFSAAVEKLKVGDAVLPDTEVGALITPAEVERVAGWVDEAVKGGGKVTTGGKTVSKTTYAPTVLVDPPANAKISTAEVFGPVVCIYGYDHIDDAIAAANSLDVSFQAAVFTRSMDTALRCYQRLDGTAVMVNDHTAFRVDWMPFAGARHSGYGVGGVPYTLHDMQIRKMLVLKSPELK